MKVCKQRTKKEIIYLPSILSKFDEERNIFSSLYNLNKHLVHENAVNFDGFTKVLDLRKPHLL